MNYRLTISYDGTRYHGWESKKEVDTIEGKLEAVFARMTEQDVKIHGAGRTDAGVHAMGMVANGYYYTTLYYADPETGELLAMSVTDYIEDGEGGATEMGTTLYNWSYDEPYETEPYKSGRYLLNDVVYATDDTRPACLLTVCLPAKEGGEDWWVNEYHVARGTYVNICCRSGCTLYADAALTQPIDDTVSIDTNGEEMTVYVVPDVPLN